VATVKSASCSAVRGQFCDHDKKTHQQLDDKKNNMRIKNVVPRRVAECIKFHFCARPCITKLIAMGGGGAENAGHEIAGQKIHSQDNRDYITLQ